MSRPCWLIPRLERPGKDLLWRKFAVNWNRRGIDFDAYHYRVSGGAEVDLVLEASFGLIPIEIKLGQRVRLQSLKGLRDFVKDHDCRFGLVFSNEETSRLIDSRVVGVPVRYL